MVAGLVAGVAVFAAAPSAPVLAATVPAGFTDTLVASVSNGTTVEVLPTGRIVVLEQTGRVRSAFPGQSLQTAANLSVCSQGERGLLGFTHDPGFMTNSLVYAYYTAPSANGCVNRVSRFTMNGGTLNVGSEMVLLDNISSVNTNHNGGDLDVGSDGNLYVAVGDAGADPRGDSGSAGRNNAAKDLSLLNGKLLRIGLDGQSPADNPLNVSGSARCATRGNTAATPTTLCSEIALWGLRNPYRIAFDPNRGDDRIFLNDVGQGTYEEVDEAGGSIGLGLDFGWNVCEGPCSPGNSAGHVDPIAYYGRDKGQYITGGAFVPNGLWPESYDGGYFFGDGGSGAIWFMNADREVDIDAPWATGAFGLSDMAFGFDENGRTALYYVTYGGQLRKITWNGQGVGSNSSNLAFEPFDAQSGTDRQYDTRSGNGVIAGEVRAGTTRLVQLNAPDGAKAAMVNITTAGNAGGGFVQAWQPRTRRQETSILNLQDTTSDVSNATVVALDDSGRFVVGSTTGVDLIVDVMGWFVETPGTSDSGRFVPLGPSRSVDTRQPSGASLPSGSTNPYTQSGEVANVRLANLLGVPSVANVESVALIVTAIGSSSGSGYVAVSPSDGPPPQKSNANTNGGGDIRANVVVVPLGADGSVDVQMVRVDDVLIDVVGYFTSDSASSSSSGLMTTVAPTRVYDERVPGTAPAPAGGSVRVTMTNGVPAMAGAKGVLQNVTMTATNGFDYVTAYPGTGSPPDSSNVNATAAGQTRAAFAFTPVGSQNGVSFFTFGESVLIVDVFGFFQP